MTRTASVALLSRLCYPARLVFTTSVAVWALICLRWKLFRRVRGKPFIPAHWLFGILPEILSAARRNEIHKFLYEKHKVLGPTIVAVPPLGLPVNAVITTDPRNVQHILKTKFDNYPKGDRMSNIFSELLGAGIFNADGVQWYHQRKATSHMFTAKLFKEHIWTVVQQNSHKLCGILKTVEPGTSVDVFNLLNRFTLDTIGEIGFGKCIGSLDDPSSPFLSSFDRAQQITVYRFLVPPGVWKLSRFTQRGAEKGSKEHFGRLDEYSRIVVRELQENLANENRQARRGNLGDMEAKKSFVALCLADAEKRGEHVSEDYLRDLVLNFLIAGRDTTAQALSWTLFCLSTHSEVEEKAREEVLRVCGVHGPSYEDLNQLPYIQAVLNEALRLYPSVPIDGKQAQQDDLWPDGTFIPKHTMVWYNIYSMGRSTTIWGDDAELFRPDRWLEMSEIPDNYHYPVFNGGPRECLGRRLAMVEMKTCLSILLPRISLQLAVPAEDICTDSQLTIGMGHGLPCFVNRLPAKGHAEVNMHAAA